MCILDITPVDNQMDGHGHISECIEARILYDEAAGVVSSGGIMDTWTSELEFNLPTWGTWDVAIR